MLNNLLKIQENVLFYLETLRVSISERDNAGFMAIHEAVAGNHYHVVKALLDLGADPNAVAQDGTR